MHTLAAVHAAEGEANPLLPHLSELIVGAIAFGCCYFFLKAKVFPVVREGLRRAT